MSEQYRQIDLLRPETHAGDPFPLYAWLREHAPLYWDETNEIWAVSRYDDVIRVSRDPATFCSKEGARAKVPPDTSMIHQDGVTHQRQRNLISKGFTPRRIADLEPKIRRITNTLLDAIDTSRSVDFVDMVAGKLPLTIIGEMLGYPMEDLAEIQRWVDIFVQGGCGPAYITEAVDDAFMEFCNYHERLVQERRNNLGDDLLSVWLTVELEGQKLDDQQLLFEHVLLLVGGSETTRNVLAGGLEELARQPEQWRLLKENPALLPNAVEEMIRWVSPFHNMARTATRDVELYGQTIKAGQQIIMMYPAANRDPTRFENPDTFDIQREFNYKPVAFGHGAHYCLGAALARLEIQVCFEELLRRYERIALTPGAECEWALSSFIRGPTHVPVLLTLESQTDLNSEADRGINAPGRHESCPARSFATS